MVFFCSLLLAFSAFLDAPTVIGAANTPAKEDIVGPFAWDDNPYDNEAVKAAERLSRAGAGARELKWVFRCDDPLPERGYAEALKLRRLVKAYSRKWDVYHMEPLPVDTNDVVAVKRALRLAIMDAARELESSLELFCKRDITVSRLKTENGLALATFKCRREPYFFVWRSEVPPREEMQIATNDFTSLLSELRNPVRVELLTGEIELVTNSAAVVVSDSPILLAPALRVPARLVLPEGLDPYENEQSISVITNHNEFGGRTDGPQLKATGRFRTAHVNGKWSLVDPEGRLYRAWGPMKVAFFGTNLDHGKLLKCRFHHSDWTAVGPETEFELVAGRKMPYILTVETAAELSRYEQAKGDKWCLGVYVKEGCGLKATQTAVKAFDPEVLYFGDSARYCDVATVKVKRDMPVVQLLDTADESVLSEPHVVGVFWTHVDELFK